ncbi:MAG TPA: Rap1a/Tai family immunity protein [Lamprocystis sp. (in: g-proteobacteria)]|nr:Rap1a/Tai family immunity protein [Lamprocystis sp. (in: g-proteobacteria)]
MATPSVAELLAACGRGYAHGNQGVDAAACEWFANPCGCKLSAGGRDGPHWCVPAAESPDATVLKVVAALRRYPDRVAPVDQVVPEILVRIYPCATGTGE